MTWLMFEVTAGFRATLGRAMRRDGKAGCRTVVGLVELSLYAPSLVEASKVNW